MALFPGKLGTTKNSLGLPNEEQRAM